MTMHILTRPSVAVTSRNSRELRLVALLMLGIFSLQLSGILRQGAIAQDFKIHYDNMLIAATQPVAWIFGSYNRTNPPLFYSTAALVYHIVGKETWPYAMGIVNAMDNLAALCCIYLLSRWLIAKVAVRLSMLAFIGFLPAFQIPSIAFAADALCQLPYFCGITALIGFLLGKISPKAMICTLTLMVGVLVCAKYTAVVLIPAGIVSLIIAKIVARLNWSSLLGSTLIFGITTTLLAFYWIYQKSTNISSHFATDMGREIGAAPNQMSLRSILFFQPGDLALWRAPSYWALTPRPGNPRKSETLFDANYFSYPGLLCDSVFSDVMNIWRPKSPWSSFGVRSHWNQRVSKFSCDLGLFWFLGIALLAFIGLLTAAWATYKARDHIEASVLVLGVFAIAWHLVILVLLHTVTMATAFGYWLPRLILPSLIIYIFIAFRTLSRLPVTQNNAANTLLVIATTAQCFLHVLVLI